MSLFFIVLAESPAAQVATLRHVKPLMFLIHARDQFTRRKGGDSESRLAHGARGSSAWHSSPSEKRNIIGSSNSCGRAQLRRNFLFGLKCDLRTRSSCYISVCAKTRRPRNAFQVTYYSAPNVLEAARSMIPHTLGLPNPYYQRFPITRWTIFIATSDEESPADSMAGRASWIRSPSRLYFAP